MDMLDICIKQGYVPPDCKLDGNSFYDCQRWKKSV